MGQITALTAQKRNPNRVNVYIDQEFAFGLAAMTAVSLRIGQTVTPADIERLQTADQLESAKETAIRFIGYRPRSVAETEKKLQEKGFEEQTIGAAIERLQELALLDDEAFAHYWVEQRETFKPKSHLAMRQELRQKGIATDIVDQVLGVVDEYQSAYRAAEGKIRLWQDADEETFRTKLMGYLQRRGFSYRIIKEVTDEMWQGHRSDQITF